MGAPRLEGLNLALGRIRGEEVRGLSVAANVHADEGRGLMIGIVNYAKELHGVQLGLLNFAGNHSGWKRWLPILNVHR